MQGTARRKPQAAREPIVIYQCSDREGSTFALSLETERMVEERFGSRLRIAPRIFIAHATPNASERIHGSLARQLLSLLTGLDEASLAELGEIEFVDPVTERRIAPLWGRASARGTSAASSRDSTRTTRPTFARRRLATRSAA